MILWIFIALTLLSSIYTLFLPKIKGYLGEKAVARHLSNLPDDKYIPLNNIMLNTDHGLTQIDHVVLSIYGIFVIETKNYSGWITGNEYSDKWVKNMYGTKYKFRNPIKQNYGHTMALMQTLKITDKDCFIPIVVFTNSAELKLNTKSLVIYLHELDNCILAFHTRIFSFQQISSYAQILTSSNVDSKESRKSHVNTIRNNVWLQQAQIKSGLCPKCGGNLVLRKGQYGRFYGCSNYPKCKFTANE